MGRSDIETKEYMRDCAHFADAFNFFLYDGRQVIDPEKLSPLDTTEAVIPYGNGAEAPQQKYRDELKLWLAMMDENAVYVVLGAENQTNVHYAMPVRNMVYDALNYSRQAESAGKSYRSRQAGNNNGPGNSPHKIHLTKEEFLSGFRKDDRLMPVITLVVFWGAAEWDGPVSLHEMLDTDDETLLSYVQDYRIHLIAPSQIADGDFEKFRTDLGKVLQYIKYSNDKTQLAEMVEEDERFRNVDEASANLINVLTGSELKIAAKEGKVDMCKAIDEMRMDSMAEGEVKGRVEGKEEGREETTLAHIKTLMKKMRISAQEAMQFLEVPGDLQKILAAKL